MDRAEIERVRDSNRIEQVIGRYVQLERGGRRYRGFCPFHDDRKSPSLVVYPESQGWWCFGACNEGGDVFDFVMKAEHVDFPEALNRLGGGLLRPARFPAPPPIEEGGVERRVLTDAHYALLTTAVEVYHAALLSNRVALSYVSGRGIESQTVRDFKIGYAAGRLKRYLAFRGWSDDLASDLGLLDAKRREWFQGRIVFPEMRRDPAQAVYLAGRKVPRIRKSWGPKYLFLAGVSKPLYGQERVRGSQDVFIVEGLVDYLLLWQWGYPAVATLGVRLKPDQMRFLRGFRRQVLVPDRDDAGRGMWKECKEAFGDSLRTVLVPEGMGDVGDLAQRAAEPRKVFARCVEGGK